MAVPTPEQLEKEGYTKVEENGKTYYRKEGTYTDVTWREGAARRTGPIEFTKHEYIFSDGEIKEITRDTHLISKTSHGEEKYLPYDVETKVYSDGQITQHTGKEFKGYGRGFRQIDYLAQAPTPLERPAEAGAVIGEIDKEPVYRPPERVVHEPGEAPRVVERLEGVKYKEEIYPTVAAAEAKVEERKAAIRKQKAELKVARAGIVVSPPPIKEVPTTAAEFGKRFFELQRKAGIPKKDLVVGQVGREFYAVPPTAKVTLSPRYFTKSARRKWERAQQQKVQKSVGKTEELTGFRKRIQTIKEREKAFFESPGFERIERVASVMTFGKGAPLEYRGRAGKIAQETVSGLMSWPIALGGTLPMIGEKLAATGEALTIKEYRQNVLREWKRAGIETAKIYKKPSLYISAAIFAAPATFAPRIMTQAALRKQLKVDIAKLTPKERALFLERLAATEPAFGVKPPVKPFARIRVERVPKKAMPEVAKLAKERGDIVGGTTAMMTQIYGKRVVPKDIDIYVKKPLVGKADTIKAAKEYAATLKKAGVERVSRVGSEVTIAGKKAIEFHPAAEYFYPNIQQIQKGFF